MANTNGNNVLSPVIELWDVTKEEVIEAAMNLRKGAADIATRQQALFAGVLIPFLCDLFQLSRQEDVEPKAFLISQGFVDTKEMDPQEKALHPLSLQSVERYFGDVKGFLMKGYTRADLKDVSLPNLRAGKPHAQANLSETTGKPDKDYVKALKTTKGQVFRQQVSAGEWGKTKAKPEGGDETPAPATNPTGGQNNEKAASINQVRLWVNVQAREDLLISVRDQITACLREIRKEKSQKSA